MIFKYFCKSMHSAVWTPLEKWHAPPICMLSTSHVYEIPSDTKLLLTKSYFEIIIFERFWFSRVISGKSMSFPEILRGQIPQQLRFSGNYLRSNFGSEGTRPICMTYLSVMYQGHSKGGSSCIYRWSSLLTVDPCCLQSVEAPIRRAFPLYAKEPQQQAKTLQLQAMKLQSKVKKLPNTTVSKKGRL